MMAIIGWIVFGLIAGIIAKAIMPGRDPGGALITIVLGIVGSLIGGFIGQALFGYGRAVNSAGDLNQPGFLMSLLLAVIGAIVLLAGYRLVVRGGSRISLTKHCEVVVVKSTERPRRSPVIPQLLQLDGKSRQSPVTIVP